MSFSDEMERHTQHCEEVIRKFLPDENSLTGEDRYARTVIEAMNYSVLAGGKRLRPMLLHETAVMYGGREELAEPFMAALEMIHTYSLVHDDLPCMDNDEYRRGRKTTHAVYGEGMATLAGDGLLNFAFETAVKAFDAAENDGEMRRVVRALKLLAKNAGVYGMVGGQCADLMAERQPDKIDENALLYIDHNKTACLIDSGLEIGAILAGAPQRDILKLGQIADNLGIAFQIQDDILDVEGSSAEIGKMTGQDARDGKVTYVTMYGLEKAKEDNRRLSEEAVSVFDSLSADNDFLREVILHLIHRRR